MKLKKLIKELLSAKLDDEVKLYSVESDKFYDVGFVNIMPSARNKGKVYIEFREDELE